MRINDIITESAAKELANKLPSLKKHDYDTIDALMKKISAKHQITGKALHDLFVRKYNATPDNWVKTKHRKLTTEDNSPTAELNLEKEVAKFGQWTAKKLNLKTLPKFDLSYDTQDAQDNHHTGGHVLGDDTIWVYVKNRNLVDILRTVFHELVHVRQEEMNMIEPGDSYPGSPIEVMADMLAGKWIKVYGEQNHYIFQ